MDENNELTHTDPTAPIAPPELRRFPLDANELQPVNPTEYLFDKPDIAPYMQRVPKGSMRSWPGIAANILCVAVVAAAIIYSQSDHAPSVDFTVPAPPAVSRPETLKQQYPEKYATAVTRINADIESKRWLSAFQNLERLRQELAMDTETAPPNLMEWVLTETLVTLASGDLSGTADTSLEAAKKVYDELSDFSKREGRPLPGYRAQTSYIRILHDNIATGAIDASVLFAELVRTRGEYGKDMDDDSEILQIEIRSSLKALPDKYTKDSTELKDKWNRASYALGKYQGLAGTDSTKYWDLEIERWTTLRDRYFTRGTADSWVFLRDEISVGDTTYTVDQINDKITEARKGKREKAAKSKQ